MNDAQSESSYIREITDYFCSLAGRVAIISSEETQVVMRWKREGVPKQCVLMGIKKAFENVSSPAVLKISGCGGFVEQYFRQSRFQSGSLPDRSVKRPREIDVHSLIGAISLNISKAAAEAEDAKVKNCLEKAARSLAGFSGDTKDFDGFLERLRGKMCGELLAIFDTGRAARVTDSARRTISSGRSFINKEEKNKVFAACLDDLTMKEAGLAGLFSPANEVREDGKLR